MNAGDNSHAGWRRRGRPRYAGALTPRQQDVFELLVTGLTNEEIAQHLGIAPNSVKSHVAEILQRLGAENRHDAVALRLRSEGSGWLAAWAPVMFLRRLPFAWLSKAAAGGALTAAAAGIALLAWGVISTSTGTTTTTGCSAEQAARGALLCPPSVAQAAAGVDAISAGASHTCALKDGGVWCWGLNNFGQLGDGNACPRQDFPPRCDRPVPVAVSGLASGVNAISAGYNHSCALKDGGIWCWGPDQGGEGAYGTVCPALASGEPFPCINTAPVAVSGLAMASSVSVISAGNGYTCWLKDGGVSCRGGNEDGSADGTACEVGYCDSHVPVAASGLASGVSAISVGWNLRCALKDGGAWCWGSNWAGQLGNDSTTDSLVPVAVSGLTSGFSAISAGDAHVCALKDGGVWCWGSNGDGQLGNDSTTPSHVPVAVPALTSGVSAISAGGGHTCALKGGGVWCWGHNSHGQIGDNSTADSHVPVAVPRLAGGVSAISAGYDHTCALNDDRIWCWGSNRNGQLGNNSTTDSPVPVAVLLPAASAGDSAGAPDAQSASQPATNSAGHRTAYVLGAAGAAAALAIIAAGVWAARRRRRIT